MRSWFLPTAAFCFALISSLTIASVREDLWLRQTVFFLLGAAVFYLASKVPFAVWMQYRWLLYVGLIVLLLAPILLGQSSRNTSRWIELGFFRLQPSQLALPIGSLVTVWFLAQRPQTLGRLFLTLLSWLPIAGIIFLSPDLGTTAVYLAVSASLLWFSGVPLRWLTALAVTSLVVVIVSWQFLLLPYQRARFLTFIEGTQQADQQHYNAAQALIAVGGGELIGTGWKKGTQSHLQFLPERQTDFIFSSFAEEFGFIGTMLVLALTGATVVVLALAARQATTREEHLYLMATAATLFVQVFVNIGMNIGLLPITGVTLPLVSYGGSSILTTMLMLGICQHSIQASQRNQPILVLR
jgi:rod shape determining protein RodA